MDTTAPSVHSINIPPDLHLQERKIRNIELFKSDLLPLIYENKKIPSIPINAFGARLQEQEAPSDFTIFSSWLAALVGGGAKEGGANGTVEGHIAAAVSK